MTATRLMCVLALALASAAPAAAQDDPAVPGAGGAPPHPLHELQAKAMLDEQDRQQLTAWLTDQLRALVAAGSPTATAPAAAPGGSPAAALRAAYAGTPGFRETYARVLNDLVRDSFGRAELVPATQLLALLGGLNDMAVHPTLIAALQDERVAVRTAAASGLARMREAIARAGSGAVTSTVDALSAAGQKETSPVALKTIYRALDFQSGADAQNSTRALLNLLDGRAQAYRDGQPAGWGAELEPLRLTERLQRGLSDADRQRLVAAAGNILFAAATRYTERLIEITDKDAEVDVQLRNTTELLVQASEALLLELTKPGAEAPKVTEAMRDLNRVAMLEELKKWEQILTERSGGQIFDVEQRRQKWSEEPSAPPVAERP